MQARNQHRAVSPTGRRRCLETSQLLDQEDGAVLSPGGLTSVAAEGPALARSNSNAGNSGRSSLMYRRAVLGGLSLVVALVAATFVLQAMDFRPLAVYSSGFKSPALNLPFKLCSPDELLSNISYSWPTAPFLGQPVRVVDKTTLPEVLSIVANSRREVVFTTFAVYPPKGPTNAKSADEEGMDAFNSNFFGSLITSGVPRVLLIGADQYSCEMTMHWANITCFVDGMHVSQGVDFAFGYPVFLKWLYLHAILEAGYHAIFADNDVAFKKDPFMNWDRSFDFQGLYDVGDPLAGMSGPQGDEPHFAIDGVCPLTLPPASYTHKFPCMSTGLMFVRSNPVTLHLVGGMVVHMQAVPSLWEQKMFQEKVLSYLIQIGNNMPALRFRLLPLDQYHNLWTVKVRERLKLPVNSVAVHCGYLHGTKDKAAALREVDAWRPAWWEKGNSSTGVVASVGRRGLIGHDRSEGTILDYSVLQT